MKLSVQKRIIGTKGVINKLRREGNIPAVIYGNNETGTPVFVNGEEIKTIIRKLPKPGLLATTVFELDIGNKKLKAVVKDIQYHVVTYDILHLDFALLSEDKPVAINVPIHLLGVADCAGIKLGGFLRQSIRNIKVSCLPKDIPQEFTFDITAMDVGNRKLLSDIEIPSGVKPLAKLHSVAIVIAKKA